MRPTENFLLFLPCGKGVEGGSGQFFSVLFCKTALAICILLPTPLSQKISRKSLARSRPLHPFRTAYRPQYATIKTFFSALLRKRIANAQPPGDILSGFLAPRYDFSGCRLLLFYADRPDKNAIKNGAKLRFHKFRNAFRAENHAARRALTSFCRKAGPSV